MSRYEECDRFFWWGIIPGIIVPCVFFIIGDLAYCKFKGIDKVYLGEGAIALLVLSALVSFFGVMIAKDNYHNQNVTKGDRALYFTGVLVCVFVMALICLTGGTKSSIFSFYLIYLPSIVAVTFTQSKVGISLICVFCFIAALVGFVYYTESGNYNLFYTSSMYPTLYLGFLFVQLLSILKLDRNGNLNSGE